ncbi:hypothetical protein BCON_0079g00020 [Botryotinia convoluta]|uniref:Uncharacterized protein n=1 Tax=Botryotinia convoluta TaxID=54673 RepID=A0A4Z1IA04_9HELO|nr:hypothetical protein BCON_0079g00020 [Botryotinia convoluta]
MNENTEEKRLKGLKMQEDLEYLVKYNSKEITKLFKSIAMIKDKKESRHREGLRLETRRYLERQIEVKEKLLQSSTNSRETSNLEKDIKALKKQLVETEEKLQESIKSEETSKKDLARDKKDHEKQLGDLRIELGWQGFSLGLELWAELIPIFDKIFASPKILVVAVLIWDPTMEDSNSLGPKISTKFTSGSRVINNRS